MKKWLSESILIKYWTENCYKYKLEDGSKIKSAQHSLPFDSYPDIQKNILEDGRIVPAEIEWNTTNFAEHKHDISVLVENNGFLFVFSKNLESFPVQQIEIDKEDFKKWFVKDSLNIANETIAAVTSKKIQNKEPQIFIYYMRSKGTGIINRKRTFEYGTDGFPETIKKKSLEMLKQIKKGDIIIVARNFKSSIKVSGGRNPSQRHKGHYEMIDGLVVTKGYYFSKSPRIWIEDKVIYPHRYKFRKQVLFEGKDVPCTIKDLGRPLHEILRKAQITPNSIEKMNSSMIVKLMSLCRK